MRRPPGRGATPRALLVVAVLLTGCSAGDDFLRGLRGFTDDTDVIATSRWKPPDVTLPPPAQWPSEQQIADEAVRLAAPVTDVPPEDQQAVVRVACEAADAVEAVGGTSADVATYVVTRSDTALAYRTQAEELAGNLVDAGDASEQVAILGRVTLCIWADS